MKTVTLPDGSPLPAIGLGTWHMGESAALRTAEVAALRLALEIGYRVVDTAEMYADGRAEQVVGAALAEAFQAHAVVRDEVFVVSKVYPHNASRAGVVAACERSLKRLALDHIDLYLLHWPGAHPLAETIAGFEALQASGRIRHWGVSNFDVADMVALLQTEGGSRCATDQVYLSPTARGAEFDLLPWLRERGMPLMAYSPLDQAERLDDPVLLDIAEQCGCEPAGVVLAWLIGKGGVMPIPKAVQAAHLRSNFAAAELTLTGEQVTAIDRRFPMPRRKTALAMR